MKSKSQRPLFIIASKKKERKEKRTRFTVCVFADMTSSRVGGGTNFIVHCDNVWTHLYGCTLAMNKLQLQRQARCLARLITEQCLIQIVSTALTSRTSKHNG